MEPKERGETAEVNAEEIVTVYVRPGNSVAAVRAAAEIKTRLEGRLDATVEPRRDRVLVRTKVKSQDEAEAVRETVADVVRGAQQTFGLNALDQPENIITLRVKEE